MECFVVGRYEVSCYILSLFHVDVVDVVDDAVCVFMYFVCVLCAQEGAEGCRRVQRGCHPDLVGRAAHSSFSRSIIISLEMGIPTEFEQYLNYDHYHFLLC